MRHSTSAAGWRLFPRYQVDLMVLRTVGWQLIGCLSGKDINVVHVLLRELLSGVCVGFAQGSDNFSLTDGHQINWLLVNVWRASSARASDDSMNVVSVGTHADVAGLKRIFFLHLNIHQSVCIVASVCKSSELFGRCLR